MTNHNELVNKIIDTLEDVSYQILQSYEENGDIYEMHIVRVIGFTPKNYDWLTSICGKSIQVRPYDIAYQENELVRGRIDITCKRCIDLANSNPERYGHGYKSIIRKGWYVFDNGKGTSTK